ncbi:MAG: alpha-L-fucosidase [Acidobacteriaceae bacterium]|nr:alpha-L-fucosidase [Acidobacteriaceae bacterium]
MAEPKVRDFIHFGLYSALGGVWRGRQYAGNYSEQIQSDAHIPEEQYAKLASQFDPEKWDPDAVVQLAQDAGMKFIVLTSKHHDGFNMFHTRLSTYNVVDATPYRRDIVKGLADACARHHMPFGVYYSTIDWHFGDVPSKRNDNPISAAHEDFNASQLKELMTNYGPISEIWFDMGHPTPLQSKHFADTVHALQPECMISGRIWNNEGDFMEMADDEIPDYILDEPWESPASIYKETWGYRSWLKRTDLEGKIQEHILRLVAVVSRGGNYILNIGPRGDGSVVEFEADVLRGTGEWLKRNGEAIYDTQPQPFRKLDFGHATVKAGRLFLFVEHVPANGRLELPGLENHIRKAYILGDPAQRLLRVDDTKDRKAILAPDWPRKEFLPVIVAEFDSKLNVLPPATAPGPDGTIQLTPETADRFYNANGEGYYDPPTLRKEQWHFAVERPGTYRIELIYKPGKFARLLDVNVGGRTFKANLYGSEQGPASIGSIELPVAKDTTLTVNRAAPAERGASLPVELDRVSLVFSGRQQ